MNCTVHCSRWIAEKDEEHVDYSKDQEEVFLGNTGIAREEKGTRSEYLDDTGKWK